jgi:NADH dehydrogenase/NADH:ubiquinone oxidoreductase subunit G
MFTITIDGQTITVPQGITLMEAIRLAGGDVPTICYHDLITPNGLCRQCVVEVEGWRVLAAACVTHVARGIQIDTHSERVEQARRTILEMLNASVDLSDAPELKEQMQRYGADGERFVDRQAAHARRGAPLQDDNPFYVRDYQKCIQCWRCVQACGNDMQFTYALAVGGRGYESRIATFYDHPMPATTCVFCGNCVGVCPTGALKGKFEFLFSQGLDFDQASAQTRGGRRRRADDSSEG